MPASDAHAYSGRWARLMPIVFITYSLAYVDRANYSFGAAAGMTQDLGIDAAAASLLGALFFLGYFFFQMPAAFYAERRSAKKLMFWSLILWGMLRRRSPACSADIRLLYVDRFLLGVVESVVLPAMLIFLSHWFTKAERSRANTFLILGNPVTVLWMSIVSGYLVHAFGWRGMFIIEGAPAIIWAFVWCKMVQDRPPQATWLDPRGARRARTQACGGTARLQAGEELWRGVSLARGDHAGGAVFLLEHRRVRLRDLAAVDAQIGRCVIDRAGRMAVCGAVSRCRVADGRDIVLFR